MMSNLAAKRAFSSLRSDLTGFQGATNLAFNEQVKKLISSGRNIFHFGFGQSPFPVPDCLQKALVRNVHQAEYVYVAGLPQLRDQIPKLHNQPSKPENVVVGVGSKQMIYLALSVMDCGVLLPSPSWTTYLPQCQLLQKKIEVIPGYFENNFMIDPGDLDRACQKLGTKNKAMILNSPNNPSGQCFSAENLTDITEICRKHNVTVISDEIYSKLAFGQNYRSMAEFYPEGTIVTSSFSKWCSIGGWRLGYAIFPEKMTDVQKAVIGAASNSHSCAPAPMQYAIAETLENDVTCNELNVYATKCSRILEKVGDFCHRNLTVVGCKAVKPMAGYYFMPFFDTFVEKFRKRGMQTAQDVCDRMLAEANVALMPCDPDYLRPAGEFSMRFCFINFDGQICIDNFDQLNDDAKKSDEFVQGNCPQTAAGIEAVKDWLAN